MKKILRLILVLMLALPAYVNATAPETYIWSTKENNVTFAEKATPLIGKQVTESDSEFLKTLYGEFFNTPVWVACNGLTPFGNQLLHIIKNDVTLTGTMASYKLFAKVQSMLSRLMQNAEGNLKGKVALEFAMTQLYKAYADYRIYGGIDWKAFDKKLKSLKKTHNIEAGWEFYRPKITPVSVLMDAVIGGDIAKGLAQAEPRGFKYAKLKQYLVKYIDIAQQKTWEKLPRYKGGLKKGKSSSIVPTIRHNLALLGDLDASCSGDMNATLFDSCLVKAVKRYQLRHGLKGDGGIGKMTYTMLNIPINKKIRIMRLNLDRIKWLRRHNTPIHMVLNIPSFRLFFYDRDKLVTTMRVIVGKRNHPTPSFGNKVQYIIVNPWWKIPQSIVKKEMLNALVQDPYHFERQGKVLRTSWDETSPRVDPGTVDWASYYGSRPIPYYFMQVPSPGNALGKIKFVFPNQFSVYIHDTPSKSLFFRNTRAFSHGCMRIQKPRELLKAFALFNENIDVPAIMKRLQGTAKQTIMLKKKVPIDITYLTAFVDDYGNLNFRNDVYLYDRYALATYRYKIDKKGAKPLADIYQKKSATKSDGQATTTVTQAEAEGAVTQSDIAPKAETTQKPAVAKTVKVTVKGPDEKPIAPSNKDAVTPKASEKVDKQPQPTAAEAKSKPQVQTEQNSTVNVTITLPKTAESNRSKNRVVTKNNDLPKPEKPEPVIKSSGHSDLYKVLDI